MVEASDAVRAERARAAAKYRPANIQLLLVAEAPPASPDRYFYFEHVPAHDSLFRHVSAGLFGVELTRDKGPVLARLRAAGVYLIDLRPDPVDSSPLALFVPDLVARCEALKPKHIILIKATVYDAATDALTGAGLPLIDRRIPFPGSGQQRRFDREFAEALRESGWRATE